MNNASKRKCTVNSIMRRREFKHGYKHALAGRFDPDAYSHMASQWTYERGWCYCRYLMRNMTCVPPTVPMEGPGAVSFEHQRIYWKASQEMSIL